MDATYIENFTQANNFLILGQIDEAISHYTNLLVLNQNYDVLINRSIAYIKQAENEKALIDTEAAILLDPSRYQGFYFRGMANFNSGKFQVALSDFNEAKNKKIPRNIIDTWISKCDLEIKLQGPLKKKREEQQVEIEKKEVNPPEPLKESVNNEVVNKEADKDDKPVHEGDLKPEADKETEEQEPHFDVVKEKIFSLSGLYNYSWYQTDNNIGLEWDQKIEKLEDIKHKFEAKKVYVGFPILGNTKAYELELSLWDEIIPETAKIILTLVKLEIKFEKLNKKKNWIRLENDDKPKKILVQDIDKPPAYPSSSRYKKDWNKIDKELDQELNQEKDEDALNKVFKDIYRNADENTRRAMIKSFQTSGGTVLSTNWDEVQKKDYEGKDRPDAPKGQEWVKRE